MKAFIILLLMTLLAGCRTPDDKILPKISDFDASVPDGGEIAPVAECSQNGEYQFNNNFSPYFGGESSVDVDVVHFSSFYCTHCMDFAAYTGARWQNRQDYMDRVRIYFHHADLGFRHRAAVAAANQGMAYFWELHDFIYSEMLKGSGPSDNEVLKYTEETLHLDMARFNADLDSERTYSFLQWDFYQGLNAGLVGTPAVYVCGDMVDYWPYLEDYVDDNL